MFAAPAHKQKTALVLDGPGPFRCLAVEQEAATRAASCVIFPLSLGTWEAPESVAMAPLLCPARRQRLRTKAAELSHTSDIRTKLQWIVPPSSCSDCAGGHKPASKTGQHRVAPHAGYAPRTVIEDDLKKRKTARHRAGPLPQTRGEKRRSHTAILSGV